MAVVFGFFFFEFFSEVLCVEKLAMKDSSSSLFGGIHV